MVVLRPLPKCLHCCECGACEAFVLAFVRGLRRQSILRPAAGGAGVEQAPAQYVAENRAAIEAAAAATAARVPYDDLDPERVLLLLREPKLTYLVPHAFSASGRFVFGAADGPAHDYSYASAVR